MGSVMVAGRVGIKVDKCEVLFFFTDGVHLFFSLSKKFADGPNQ